MSVVALPSRSGSVPTGLWAIVEVNHRRLALLRYIASSGGATVAELADAFSLTLAAVRLHLAKLEAAGLVEEERLAPVGPGRPRNRYRATTSARELLDSLALLIEPSPGFSPIPRS